MRRPPILSHNSGTYTSPGTPDYRNGNTGGIQKGWSSERVPPPSNSSQRLISSAALSPFSSGRTFPSKWDDAERWITSPVSGLGVANTLLAQAQKRPKSKSGPLGTPGVGCASNHSPAIPALLEGNVVNFMAGSPFTTGVLVPNAVSVQYSCHSGIQPNPVHIGNAGLPTAGLPGWADLLSQSSSSSQDEQLDDTKDVETKASLVSRRDVATQMSPRDSTSSSSRGRSSFSTSHPSILPVPGLHHNHLSELEIRDLQVDKKATATRHRKEIGLRKMKNGPPDVKELTLSWDIADTAENRSKLQREEARITAWENLQKAKAEEAIRKLEMKLEKKRSASMDMILNKLQGARMKAEEMRSSTSGGYARAVPKTSHKVKFFHRYVKLVSLRGCFFCHAS